MILQIAIVEAAVAVEVGVLREINSHRLLNMIVLERVVQVCQPALRRKTPECSRIIGRVIIRLNRVATENRVLYLPTQDDPKRPWGIQLHRIVEHAPTSKDMA